MTPVPPTPGGSYTPACGKFEWSRSCLARASASSFISSLLPKCRQPVGHDLIHAGSRPSLTRSAQSVHLKTRCVSRSEEHTSELQSRLHLVCRLLLEKKKKPHHTPPSVR